MRSRCCPGGVWRPLGGDKTFSNSSSRGTMSITVLLIKRSITTTIVNAHSGSGTVPRTLCHANSFYPHNLIRQALLLPIGLQMRKPRGREIKGQRTCTTSKWEILDWHQDRLTPEVKLVTRCVPGSCIFTAPSPVWDPHSGVHTFVDPFTRSIFAQVFKESILSVMFLIIMLLRIVVNI